MELYSLFLVMATVTIMSPGPGVLMTLTNALHYGRRETFAGIAGIASGASVVAAISATSLGVVLAASTTLYTILRFAGAAYLVYLGVRMLRAKALSISERQLNDGSPGRRFLEAVTLQLTNPKAIFFFLSVFPQFIRPSSSYQSQFALLVATYAGLVVVIHCIYAAFAKGVRQWIAGPIGGRWISRCAGVIFIAFGLGLAFAG
jgi:threonine/homoserine/homoserine lactone efflux protein